MSKRKVDILVLSDIHLGTYGCHAQELLNYLKSIDPKKVVLNGDIIDIWQFKKSYWPKSHMKVIKMFMDWITKDVPVYYITGNHDEMLRKFVGFKLHKFQILNKLVIKSRSKKMWIFHGDVFDVTMRYSRWLAKLGAIGYDFLILLNRAVNYVLEKLGRDRYSLSKKVKDSVKSAIRFINDFENTAANIAIDNGFDHVICGHIHRPIIKDVVNEKGRVTYLNSGDWIENLTALEFNEGKWSIYRYLEDLLAQNTTQTEEEIPDSKKLFEEMLLEFQINLKKD
ncbi:MAG: UDP-2,3-diacylglucosamine diphosphatase [Flavobacteriales bacterium]|nr:UDP-2,3-diacylglucosamine diphosphatase [Flavobacteriales bacterium]